MSAFKCVGRACRESQFHVRFTPESASAHVRFGPIADISAKHPHKFSSERGDKPPLRAQPYSSHKCERSPSQGWPVIAHVNGDSLRLCPDRNSHAFSGITVSEISLPPQPTLTT